MQTDNSHPLSSSYLSIDNESVARVIKNSPKLLQAFGVIEPPVESKDSFSLTEHHANDIWKAIRQHSNAPAGQGIFESTWLYFSNLVRWIFGWKTIPSADELRLSLGMNLFKNWEPDLPISKQGGYELPFSLALENYHRSLVQSGLIDASSKELEALKESVLIARQIEKARDSTASKRSSILSQLAKSIETNIDKLEPNRPIYIPGGFMEYEGMDLTHPPATNLFLENHPIKTNHLLYEVRKNATDGKLTLRIYNYSKKIEAAIKRQENMLFVDPLSKEKRSTAVFSIELERADFSKELVNLLEVYAAPHVKHNMNFWDLLLYNWSLRSKVLREEQNFTEDLTISDFSSLRFKTFFIGLAEREIRIKKVTGTTHKYHSNTDPVKILKVFDKFCAGPKRNRVREQYRELLNKTLNFIDLFKTYEGKLSKDPIIRKWLRDSALNLLKNYKQSFEYGEQQPPAYAEIIKYFSKTFIDKIEKALQEDTFNIPPSPAKQTSSSSNFSDLLICVENTVSMSEYKSNPKAEVTTPPSKAFLPPIDFGSKHFDHILTTFEEWIGICDDLSAKRSFDDLNFVLQNIYFSLESADQHNFWSSKLEKDFEKWSSCLHRLCIFSTQVHFGQHRKGPNPHQILFLLKLLYRVLALARKNHEVTCIDHNYAIDMVPFYDILKDPYLDLGSYGPEIKNYLIMLCGSSNLAETRPLDLTSAKKLEHQPNNDQIFFKECLKKITNAAETNAAEKITEDFGTNDSGLAPQVIHLRQMKILMLSMMAKNRTLGKPEVLTFSLNIARSVFACLRKKTSDLDTDYLKRVFDDINNHLRSAELPVEFNVKNYFLYPDPVIHLPAYNLDFLGYDQTFLEKYGNPFFALKIPAHQYVKTAQEVPRLLATHVVEGCVANGQFEYVSENGNEIDPGSDSFLIMKSGYRYIPTGAHPTEREIFNDRKKELGLPQEAWAELRSLQSSPLGMRIPGTIAFFTRHPYCLTRSLQRVFSLNLFRNGALYEYFLLKRGRVESFFIGLRALKEILSSTDNFDATLFIERMINQAAETYKKLMENYHKTGPSPIKPSENFAYLRTWRKNPDLKKNSRSIHYEYLLYIFSNLQEQFKDVSTDFSNSMKASVCFKVVESYYQIKQIPQPMHERNREHEEQIAYLMRRLSARIIACLNEDRDKRNEFLNKLTRLQTKSELTWEETSSPLEYKAGDYRIDLEAGLLYYRSVANCYLPDSVVTNPTCLALFNHDNKIHQIDCNRWNISKGDVSGQMYQFIYRQVNYRIVLMPNQQRLIYKKIDGRGSEKHWYQLHTIKRPEIKENENTNSFISQIERSIEADEKALYEMKSHFPNSQIPDEIFKYYYWKRCDDDHFVVTDSKEICKFSGKTIVGETKVLEDNSILHHLETSDIVLEENSQHLLNPWEKPEFSRFLAIASCNQVMALGKRGKVERIKYLENPHEYVWNSNTGKWETPIIPGYSLSGKKIEEVMRLKSQVKSTFFDNSYTHYHLLEHETRPPILLLSGSELQRSVNRDEDNYIVRYNRKKISPKFTKNSKQHFPFYQYEIDPLSGLKADRPEAYFYLAYVLFSQSKYDQALFYLEKAQNIKPGRSQECRQIHEWFENWKTASKSAHVVLLHVHWLILQQMEKEKIDQESTHDYNNQLQRVIFSFSHYLRYEKEQTLKPNLAITLEQRRKLEHYLVLTEDSLENSTSTKTKNAFSATTFESNFDASLESLRQGLRSKNNEYLETTEKNLIAEITALKQRIEHNQEIKAPTQPSEMIEGVSLFPEFENFLRADELNLESNSTVGSQISILGKALQRLEKKDPLAFKIGNDLLTDIKRAQSNQKSEKNKLLEDVPLESIRSRLSTTIKELEDDAHILKEQIIAFLHVPFCNNSGWDAAINRLKEYADTSERYFVKALHCCYSENWVEFNSPVNASVTSEKGKEKIGDHAIINPDDIDEIKRLAGEFLKVKTKLQQYQKAQDYLKLYQDTQLIIHLNRLGEVLAIKRFYDPDCDPNRFKLLLLEHQQRVIVTKDQLECFIANKEIPNLFIHRPLGGGKTSVSRPLSMNPDGTNLCGTVTDEPLIPIHHPMLEETATEAYGLPTHLFRFKRGDPSDRIALRKILRDFLKIIAFKGFLDFSKNDVLSLMHLLKEKYFELHEKTRSTSNIQEEISVLQEIFGLLSNQGVFNCDEFDKVTTPTTQLNWTFGNETLELDDHKSNAVLFLMRLCLTGPLKDYFKKGHQHNLKKAQIAKLMHYFAEKVIKAYDLHENKKIAFEYFTKSFIKEEDPELKAVDEYYESNIKTHKHKEELVWIYKFMHSIIIPTLQKQNGVRYIRSEQDKFCVKPTPLNGKCNELSEHCTEEEGMWYTCLNYMDSVNGGIKPEQVASIVLHAKNTAANSVLESLRRGVNLDFEQTKEFSKFKKDFKRNLFEITEKDYPFIAQEINKDPKMLSQFILNYVFATSGVKAYKMSGTTENFVDVLNEFYGCAGTTNNVFPEGTEVRQTESQPYAKQPGVDGYVLLAIFKDFCPEDLIPCDFETPGEAAMKIAHYLSEDPGSSLIDLSAFFPGMTADKLAQFLAPYMPDKKLRYKKEENIEEVLNTTTYAIDSSSLNINPEQVNTLFSKDQERGLHVNLALNGVGYVTVYKIATLTEFLQGCMRMRRLGKGQRLRFFLPSNFSSLSKMIITFIKNESKELKKLQYKSQHQKITSIIENVLFKYGLCSIKDPFARKALSEICKPFFVKPTQQRIRTLEDLDSVGKPTVQKSSRAALSEQAEDEIAKLERLIDELKCAQYEEFENLISELNNAKERLTNKIKGIDLPKPIYLPEFVESHYGKLEIDSTTVAEKENENEASRILEMDLEQQLQEQQQAMTAGTNNMIDPPWEDLKIYNTNMLINAIEGEERDVEENESTPFLRLSTYVNFYDTNLYLTRNLYTPQTNLHWGAEDRQQPLSNNLIRPTRMAIVVDKTNGAVTGVLGSIKDFDHIFNEIDILPTHVEDRYHFYIYNLYSNQLEGCNAHWNASYESLVHNDITRLIVQAKLFSGAFELLGSTKEKELNNPLNQTAVFKNWLREKMMHENVSSKKIEASFIKYLKRMRPDSLQTYFQSPMHQIFKDLEKGKLDEAVELDPLYINLEKMM